MYHARILAFALPSSPVCGHTFRAGTGAHRMPLPSSVKELLTSMIVPLPQAAAAQTYPLRKITRPYVAEVAPPEKE